MILAGQLKHRMVRIRGRGIVSTKRKSRSNPFGRLFARSRPMATRPSLLKLPPFPPEQEALRSEWRNLCFALERLQADALLANCRDKFEFAKTFARYGAGFDALYE